MSNHEVTESEKAMLELVQAKRFLDLERVPLICKDIKNISDDISGIRTTLDSLSKTFVTQDQFWPVKALVYGLTAMILSGVIGWVLAVAMHK